MISWNNDTPMIQFWSEGDTYHLDVREFLENGGEPYSAIMECVSQIDAPDTLVIHALFEPKPLIGVVRRMGLEADSHKEGVDHWTLSIRRTG